MDCVCDGHFTVHRTNIHKYTFIPYGTNCTQTHNENLSHLWLLYQEYRRAPYKSIYTICEKYIYLCECVTIIAKPLKMSLNAQQQRPAVPYNNNCSTLSTFSLDTYVSYMYINDGLYTYVQFSCAFRRNEWLIQI